MGGGWVIWDGMGWLVWTGMRWDAGPNFGSEKAKENEEQQEEDVKVERKEKGNLHDDYVLTYISRELYHIL